MAKAKVTWYKVKNRKQTKIRKPKSIDKLLDQGYAVSKVTERKKGAKIMTYSARKRRK